MSISTRSIRVLQLPSVTTPEILKSFLTELRQYTDAARPRFVLDCSTVSTVTLATIELMVCVLEEAMKSNGDVRLAAMSIEGKALLVSAGASRLFETFASVDIAIGSYRRAASMAPLDAASMNDLYANEAAA